jgi:hypothetical protein
MVTYFCVAVIVALSAFESWLFLGPYFDEAASRHDAWRRRRESVRQSAVDQQLQAMRAAQQLSLLAWKARHDMYDLGSREGDSGPAQRR